LTYVNYVCFYASLPSNYFVVNIIIIIIVVVVVVAVVRYYLRKQPHIRNTFSCLSLSQCLPLMSPFSLCFSAAAAAGGGVSDDITHIWFGFFAKSMHSNAPPTAQQLRSWEFIEGNGLSVMVLLGTTEEILLFDGVELKLDVGGALGEVNGETTKKCCQYTTF